MSTNTNNKVTKKILFFVEINNLLLLACPPNYTTNKYSISKPSSKKGRRRKIKSRKNKAAK